MKNYISICFTLICFSLQAQFTTITTGTTAPVIKLKNVDNKICRFSSINAVLHNYHVPEY